MSTKLFNLRDIEKITNSFSDNVWDSYHSWLILGRLLNFLNSQNYDLWDKNSQRSKKYNQKACETYWKGFDNVKKDHEITLNIDLILINYLHKKCPHQFQNLLNKEKTIKIKYNLLILDIT